MYTFDELTQKYGPAPRKMDAYLRPLTLVETGEETSFPLVKILVVTALTVAATYGISMQFDFRFAISLFVACPLWLGVVIQLIRSASVTERNNKRLQEGPLVLGRIVQGHTRLYSPGVERGLASVVFSRDEAHRMDDLYLKDVAKRIRSAKESDSPADDLVDVVALVKQSAGRPICLPKSVANDGDTWIGIVDVNPERLPENKVVGQKIPLLVSPEDGLVAHL